MLSEPSACRIEFVFLSVLRHNLCLSCKPASNILLESHPPIATPKAINDSPSVPSCFFARPAEVVAPDLIGCLLVKRQPNGELPWGVIVETEAYSQDEPACHGYRRRSLNNEALVCLEAGLGAELSSVDEELARIRTLRESLTAHSFDPEAIHAFKREGRP